MSAPHPTLIPTVFFREVQHLFRNPIVLALVPTSALTTAILMLGLWHKTGNTGLLWTLLAILVSEAAFAALLRLETTVTDTHLTVRFRPLYRRRIPIEEIDEFEPVRYNPLGDAGGWGIRRSRKFGRVLNAYGDRAVRLTTTSGARMLIGSQRPDELAAAIAAATRRPDHPLSNMLRSSPSAPQYMHRA